jgi:hypothetical protein
MSPQPPFYDDLDEALRASWNLLGRGVADRRSGFHTLSLATIGLTGAPRLRTVVSRNVDWSTRSLRFHCDRRTDKFAEIRREPRIALHGYDAGAKIQIRLEGHGRLHTEDPVADEAWAASRISSRIGYGTAPAPGTILDQGGAFDLPAGEEEIAAGRVHFCTVVATVETVEFLYLAFEGHRRARFDWNGEQWKGAWLAP